MPDKLTPDELAAIEARANAATPGLWLAYCPFEGDDEVPAEWHVPAALSVATPDYDAMNEADAQFVAHARADIPALIHHIRALEAELATVRKAAAEAVEAGFVEGAVLAFKQGEKLLTKTPVSGWNSIYADSNAKRGADTFKNSVDAKAS